MNRYLDTQEPGNYGSRVLLMQRDEVKAFPLYPAPRDIRQDQRQTIFQQDL